MSGSKRVGRPVGSSSGGARSLTDAEVVRLLKVARAGSLRDYAYLAFLLGTGARVSEPLMLKVSDVAPDGTVLESVALDKNQTKNGKSRRLWLSQTAAKAMKAYLAAEDADLNRPLFIGRAGKPLNSNYATQLIGKLMVEAGIPDASSHSCRKTFATKLVENGIALPHIQKLLGHSSLATTQKYLTSTDADLSRAVGTLSF